jgi:RNA polymerase-binding transcription factor DksA
MLKSLHITNLQSHAESTLTFHEGTNIIIGSSDAGKSALIRSMRRVIFGRPTGDSLCSYWGGETLVELCTEEGSVAWHRNKVDTYVLVTADGKEIVFKAVGTTVPQEVQMLLNINEVNIGYQLDSHFLLSLSPGQVAEHFNRVAHLEKIDTGLFNVNKAIRELTSDIAYKTTQQEQLVEDLKRFDHLERFEAEVEVLEQMEQQLRGMKSSLDNLQLLYYDYCECSKQIDEYSDLLSGEKLVNTVLDLYKQKVQKVEEYEGLRSLLDNYFLISDDIEDAQEQVKDEATVNTLIELNSKLKTANEGQRALRKLLLDINYNDILINKKATEIASLEAKFKKEMGKVCFYCGQVIKNKKK